MNFSVFNQNILFGRLENVLVV